MADEGVFRDSAESSEPKRATGLQRQRRNRAKMFFGKEFILTRSIQLTAVCVALAFLSPLLVYGQAPPTAPLAIPNPHYVTIAMEIDVDRPAADVWKRVGKYCDIGEWFRIPCTITSGKDGEFGAVRSVANEVLVGKTELSYTYTQPVHEGRPYDLYHGTLEARPVTSTTSKLVYTLVFDNSIIPEEKREADMARRRSRFTEGLRNMKLLAEGGTLPPAPAVAR